MKKLLLILLLALIFASSAFSDSFYLGFDAGYAMNLMSTKTPWSNAHYLMGHGADIEFTFEYFPLSWLSLNTGLRYVQKSYNYQDSYAVPGYGYYQPNDYIEMNHFIEIPLTIRFYIPITEGERVFLGGGGFIGLWAGSNAFNGWTIRENNYNGSVSSFEYGDNRFSAGVIGEAGFDFLVSEGIRLLTTFKYLGSLTSLTSDYQRNTYHRYNDTLLFTIGAEFEIGG